MGWCVIWWGNVGILLADLCCHSCLLLASAYGQGVYQPYRVCPERLVPRVTSAVLDEETTTTKAYSAIRPESAQPVVVGDPGRAFADAAPFE